MTLTAPLTVPIVGVYDLTDDFEQTLLIRTRRDLTSEKPRLTPGADIGGSKAARGDAEHGQIGLAIADGNCLGILCQGPVSQRDKTRSLVDPFSNDGCVNGRVMESETIEPQVY